MSYWYTGCGRGRSEKSGISEMMKTGSKKFLEHVCDLPVYMGFGKLKVPTSML